MGACVVEEGRIQDLASAGLLAMQHPPNSRSRWHQQRQLAADSSTMVPPVHCLWHVHHHHLPAPPSLPPPAPICVCLPLQSELELRKYRESLGLIDPTGATGAVIPLNEVCTARGPRWL